MDVSPERVCAICPKLFRITKETVELLLGTFERVEEIDAARAKSSLQRAQDRKEVKEIDTARNDASLLRALNRLKVSKR